MRVCFNLLSHQETPFEVLYFHFQHAWLPFPSLVCFDENNDSRCTSAGTSVRPTHRDGQIDALASALDPITHGETGEHTLIDGPSESGKTALAKYVARELDQERLDFR
jgi:ABC-type uncharacterized transport system fused permease/ATPase subunit